MEEELEQYRSYSLSLCERLLRDLNKNKDDADRFFRGEMYKAYVDATEKAIERAKKCRRKLRNL